MKWEGWFHERGGTMKGGLSGLLLWPSEMAFCYDLLVERPSVMAI